VSHVRPGLVLAALTLLACSATPDVPSAPAGPAWSIAGEQTEYVVAGTANRGAVSIQSDWGDGDTSIWSEWLPSGVAVAVGHAWDTAGSYQALVRARSSTDRVSDWSAPTSVRVLPQPGYPSRVVGSVRLNGKARQVAVTPDGSRLVVRNSRRDLSVVRTADMVVETSCAALSYAFAVDRSSQYLYNRTATAIIKLELPGLGVADSLPSGDTIGFSSLVASPSRNELYTLSSVPGTLSLWNVVVIDADSLRVLGRMGRLVDPLELVCSPDGRALYELGEGELRRFDVETRTQTAFIGIGPDPVIVATSADGRHLYVAEDLTYTITVVDATTLQPLGQLPGLDYSGSYAVAPSNRFLYHRHRNTFDSLAVYEMGTWRKIADFDPGQAASTWSYVVPSYDGLRLYLVPRTDSLVQVLGF
jgi:DNA-binding beta-propeller fold protein YncE